MNFKDVIFAFYFWNIQGIGTFPAKISNFNHNIASPIA